ncbi:MAG: extracellular solute-binding protein [Clostridia bacterium]|nr:extracellular solute-binding protein [Clostridia bacterium]
MKINGCLKRAAALAMSVCVLFGVTGCSDGGKKAANKDVKVVTIWSTDSHSKDVYQDAINEWNNTTGKEKGIEIEYIVKEGDTLNQSIEVALQSGDAPELFTGGNAMRLAESKYIIPLEDIPGSEELLKKYEPVIRPGKLSEKYNGTYTLPVAVTTQALVYNKDMFKAAGLVDKKGNPTPPKTYEELREYAKKLTNPKKKEYGIILPMKWSGWFNHDIAYAMMASAGHPGWNPVEGKYEYDKLIPIAETFMGIKKDNSYYPGAESLDNDAARARFAAGGVGMKFAMSFDVGVYNDQFPADINWGVAPVPVLDTKDTYMQRSQTSVLPWINSKALETVGAEAILEVYKFLASDEFMIKKLNAGVELPIFSELIDKADFKNAKKGWKEFAELLKISETYPNTPSNDSSKISAAMQDRFVNEVWSGKISAKQMINEYTAEVNTATTAYYEAHTDEKLDTFILADWNTKRK